MWTELEWGASCNGENKYGIKQTTTTTNHKLKLEVGVGVQRKKNRVKERRKGRK